jgi:hypothetical protein
MGEQLVRCYKFIGDEMGHEGKTLLARETKIPVTRAALVADSEENIRIFHEAIEKITGKPAPICES